MIYHFYFSSTAAIAFDFTVPQHMLLHPLADRIDTFLRERFFPFWSKPKTKNTHPQKQQRKNNKNNKHTDFQT